LSSITVGQKGGGRKRRRTGKGKKGLALTCGGKGCLVTVQACWGISRAPGKKTEETFDKNLGEGKFTIRLKRHLKGITTTVQKERKVELTRGGVFERINKQEQATTGRS